ncbi:hypothetical protein HNY73_001578 [Argiope bruennichi]|uniref:Uncharacterized protein n=1 Tax=Argiope bruennichi TaxID=94029 RepID=A0A8T0G1Q8_ARGBR|nr:hypothetical protein HNY73_001578 [Argiope bruennichi]
MDVSAGSVLVHLVVELASCLAGGILEHSGGIIKAGFRRSIEMVDELKAILETYNKNCNKAICDLKEELSEERRLRSMIELELQKLKECQKT